MTVEVLQQHWALLAASVIGAVVALFVVLRLYGNSANGRLHRCVHELRGRQREAGKAARAATKANRRLGRLRARADAVRPRRIDAAAGRLADAEALQKLADDQVLIAQNRVRQVIVEEYPPKRQSILRDRYLPRLQEDGKPFSF